MPGELKPTTKEERERWRENVEHVNEGAGIEWSWGTAILRLVADLERKNDYPRPWRQGRKVPRNIYAADDTPIVMMPMPELAALVVASVNAVFQEGRDAK